MINKLKQLPIGIQSFGFMREDSEKYVYVDKTENIYNVLKHKACFLSRPRRFGKSLLCSTIKALFENKRELFKNLWIDSSDWVWKEYPVIFLSFGLISRENAEDLKHGICRALKKIAKKYEVDLPENNQPWNMLDDLIIILKEKTNQNVVLLVDEYDKPIIDHISNLKIAEENRVVLSNFFETIKNLDDYTQFVFLTGVSKFSKASVFSGINNLIDLTNNKDGATLCGYTHQELLTNFDEHIEQFSQERKISKDELIEKLRTWYDGYCFFDEHLGDKSKYVYNPFSILNSLSEQKIENYWFLSGTPRFLIKLIKEKELAPTEIETENFPKTNLSAFDIEKLPVHTLLLQTGYLTFESYDEEEEVFSLKYPNVEVRKSFIQQLAYLFTDNEEDFNGFVFEFKKALRKNDIEKFLQQLQSFFTTIPYTMYMKKEKYFQSLFYVLVSLLGGQCNVERPTNNGRIDAVLENNEKIFIIEFKYNKTVESALKQIHKKKYFEPFLHKNKPVVLVGINFDIEKKEMNSDWIVEDFVY